MTARWHTAASVAALVAVGTGCPAGREPPALTPTVAIAGGTYQLGGGNGALRCDTAQQSPEEARCDAGKVLEPLLWLDDLTWVPRATATLEPFFIDVHEVSNAQYEHCVESGACTPPAVEVVADVAYYGQPDYAGHPVVYVSREQAADYCRFAGKLLPTEAQWEVAARLTSDGTLRTFPWQGVEHLGCKAVFTSSCRDQQPDVFPLRSAGHYGGDVSDLRLRHMASNVSEWVRDGWSRYAYCDGGAGYPCQTEGLACAPCQADSADDRCARSCDAQALVICRSGGTYQLNVDNRSESVVRGGSYKYSACFHRLYVRRKEPATTKRADLGFRCVSDRAAGNE